MIELMDDTELKHHIKNYVEYSNGKGLIPKRLKQLEDKGVKPYLKTKLNIKQDLSIQQILYEFMKPNDLVCNVCFSKKPSFLSYTSGYKKTCDKCSHLNNNSIRNHVFKLGEITESFTLNHFRWLKHFNRKNKDDFAYFLKQLHKFIQGGIQDSAIQLEERLNKIRELGFDSASLEKFTLMYGEELGKLKFDENSKHASFINSVEYYIEKYGDETGKLKFKELNSKKDSGSLEAHIKRHGEEIGKIKYKEFCEFQRTNNSLEFQQEKYGKEKGLELFNESKKKLIENSNTTIEYYLKRGHSLEEAKELQSERQTTFSKEICIEKYGEEEGLRVWQDRQDRWLESFYDKTEEEMKIINTKKNPNFKWIQQYFNLSEEETSIKLSSIDIDSYKSYSYEITKLTAKTYQNYLYLIDPKGLRGYTGDKYDLDHKFSRLMGFLLDVPVEIMSCKHNLEIMRMNNNKKKGAYCSITLEELTELYKKDTDVTTS